MDKNTQQPVAWCELTQSGKIGYFDGKPLIMVGDVGNDCHQTPLFTYPPVPRDVLMAAMRDAVSDLKEGAFLADCGTDIAFRAVDYASIADRYASKVRPVVPFKYKIDYVAAWLSERSIRMLQEAGITKLPHLTTFFDGYGQLSSMTPHKWDGNKTAKIEKVVEWPVGDTLYLIAELDCRWSAEINAHYLQQGAREDLPHKPHITLAKRVPQGEAAKFQHLVGVELEFVRHGVEQPASAQPAAVPDDVTDLLKDLAKYAPSGLCAPTALHGFAIRASTLLSAAQKTEGGE